MTTTSPNSDAYSVGYQDGESSANADWMIAVTEEFDFGDAEVTGPQCFVRLLRRHYTIVRNEDAK